MSGLRRVWQKPAAAHEHAVVAGRAPFNPDVVLKLASFAGHADDHIARCHRSAMQHTDSGAADFPRHRCNRVATLRANFCGYRQFETFVLAVVRNVQLPDALKDSAKVIDRRTAPGIVSHQETPAAIPAMRNSSSSGCLSLYCRATKKKVAARNGNTTS